MVDMACPIPPVPFTAQGDSLGEAATPEPPFALQGQNLPEFQQWGRLCGGHLLAVQGRRRKRGELGGQTGRSEGPCGGMEARL